MANCACHYVGFMLHPMSFSLLEKNYQAFNHRMLQNPQFLGRKGAVRILFTKVPAFIIEHDLVFVHLKVF